LSEWLAGALGGLRAFDTLLIIAALLLVTLVATEAMSNVATLTPCCPSWAPSPPHWA
jgi:di/tricarboxylate transporter